MTISPLDFTSLSDVSEPAEAPGLLAVGAWEPPPPQAVRARASPARVAASAERREWARFMAVTFFFRRQGQATRRRWPPATLIAARQLKRRFISPSYGGRNSANPPAAACRQSTVKKAEWGRSPTAATTHPPNV